MGHLRNRRSKLSMGDAFPIIRTNRTSFLLKWLDLPTLCEDPSYLLALLHNRSHHSPAEWARFDGDEISEFFQQFLLELNFNPHCVIIEGPRFGTLAQWSPDAAHRREMVGYPLGELILEAQNALATFLRSMVDALVQTVDAQTHQGSVEWYRMSALAFKRPAGSPVLQSDYIHVAYSKPPKFDVDRLVEIVECRFEATGDDLWQMQANPLAVREMFEGIKTTSHHLALSPLERRSQLMLLLVSYIRPYSDWKFIAAIALRLQDLQSSYDAQQIRCGRNLPDGYEKVLKLLELLLRRQFEAQLEHSRHLTALVPNFQHHYRFASPEEREMDPSLEFFEFTATASQLWMTDPLFHAISCLTGYADRKHLGSPQLYFQMIEQFGNQPLHKGDAPIPDFLWRHLSGMITCHEALTLIWSHTPACRTWSRQIDPYAFLEVTEGPAPVFEWMFGTLSSGDMKGSWKRLSPLIETFMALPSPTVEGCRDPVPRLESCYVSLSNFWQEVGDVLLDFSKAEDDKWSSLPEYFLDHVSAHETYEFHLEMLADCSMLRRTCQKLKGMLAGPVRVFSSLQCSASGPATLTVYNCPTMLSLQRQEHKVKETADIDLGDDPPCKPVRLDSGIDPNAGLSMIERLRLGQTNGSGESNMSAQIHWGSTETPDPVMVQRKVKIKRRPNNIGMVPSNLHSSPVVN